MLMEMQAIPAAPPKPSYALVKRADTARSAVERAQLRRQNSARRSMRSLSNPSLKGLGATPAQQYSQWYYTNYLPYYTSSLQAQNVYQNFTYPFQSLLQRYYGAYNPATYGYAQSPNAYPYQYGPYPLNQGYGSPYQSPQPVYGYTGYSSTYNPYAYGSGFLPQGDQYLYLRNPQQCAGQGGIWDAFAQSCSNPNTPAQANPATVPVTPTANVPSVLGYSKFSAADMLNRAGYETWLVQEDGGYFNPPQGYDVRRVNIWVSNGVVQKQTVG